MSATLGSVSAARGEEYVVRLDPGQDPAQRAAADAVRFGGTVEFVYRNALLGYAMNLPSDQADALAASKGVAAVERAAQFTPAAAPSSTCPFDFCQFVPRGIDRIDGDSSSTKSGDGKGSVPVNVAVLDTGIALDQPDLNVVGGVDCTGSGTIDDQGSPDFAFGHGTFVAGVIGARDDASFVVGAAPGARLYAVKVGASQRDNLTDPGILCGIDWVTSTRTDSDPGNDIAVANMSLGRSAKGNDETPCGAPGATALHEAVCAMVRAGVVPVVSAGNDGEDIDNWAPARFNEVLTVTAMADFDGAPGAAGTIVPGSVCAEITAGDDGTIFAENRYAGFSNFVTLADDRAHTVAAPGVCIPSTVRPATGSYVGLAHGTSFAAPHVSGTVALCIATGACRGLTVPQIIAKIVSDAGQYTLKHPGFGFSGDPLHPVAGRYYGYLVRAAAY
ncbi:MAG TPA: S8 family serine peptidase [Thermoleophilaceae bacterium]|nr:S8 family serine peptidase [Thermoleophilaceae bacterium]